MHINTRIDSRLRCSTSTSRISAGSLSRVPKSWMVLRLRWLVLGSEYCRIYRFCSRVDLLNSSWMWRTLSWLMNALADAMFVRTGWKNGGEVRGMDKILSSLNLVRTAPPNRRKAATFGQNSHPRCCPTLHFTSSIAPHANGDIDTGQSKNQIITMGSSDSKVDDFSQWTRPKIGVKEYYLDDQKGIRKSIRIATRSGRNTADLAGFAKLPLELIEDIIAGLNLISFVRLSATNSAFRNLLCERPEFANTIAFAPHVVRAMCKARCWFWILIS
ncbi:hypothetical protein BDZ85DRAFT_306161 [Elsinoe ampelina]|uniref:F-box domain-containing protein n=1 Tax=Elsinoe ampelina TaxID=302913 RepID=A0A6A6GMF1_9PEZI|nr:hypothetical protein BDZ85DRAFT_306161 [Elsinoe ampelina]